MRIRTLMSAVVLGAGVLLAAPLAAAPALAATPGSDCTIEVLGDGGSEVPGTVSSDGEMCVPNTPQSGVLVVLNVGAACGTTFNIPLSSLPYVPTFLVQVICDE
jgi:hypothetical protein